MIKKLLIRFIAFIVLIFFSNKAFTISVVNVQTAGSDIIVVVLEALPGEEDLIPNTTLNNWIINELPAEEIGLYSYVWDEGRAVNGNPDYFPLTIHHHVYLNMANNLISGTTYTITTPYGNTILDFDDRLTLCESIKVNQVGYDEKSTVRYANFGIFMGDLGSKQLAIAPIFNVWDRNGSSPVHTGTLSYWGDDTGMGVSKSGEYVYRIDLASIPVGGPYYISIENVGRSYSFGVGIDYSKEIAKVHAQGMYHQRCGLAMTEPYTKHTRGQCHTEVAYTKQGSSNGVDGTGWIYVPEGAQMFPMHGGYHDAGDFDRRIFHKNIPIQMLSYFEAFPEHFIDKQYHVADTYDSFFNPIGDGNGIPDFLDEALWGVLQWENLQLNSSNTSDTSEYGGVMSGTEANRHPNGLYTADLDQLVYGTYDVTPLITLASAGMFMHASRLLEPYDAERALALYEKGMLAWQYINRHSITEPVSMYSYALLQRYLITATGNQATDRANPFHTQFRTIADEVIVNGTAYPEQYLGGNGNIKTFHFSSYLITPYDVDPATKNALISKLKTLANNGGYQGWTPEVYPYAQGVTKFNGWGANTAQGRYAILPAFAYRVSTDETEKQHYYDLVSQYGNFSLGLNPLGKSFVTKLGTNQVNSPLHIDSYPGKYGEGQFLGHPIGNAPGIVIYGPTDGRSGTTYQLAVSNKLYPAWEEMPGQRRWCDGWSLVNSNEFTTWETMVWNTCMYAFLYNASEDENATTPLNAFISDETFVNLIDTCIGAIQTVTVAGDETTVVFENGSSTNLIAGQNIKLLPGFHAQQGSYLNANITLEGSFCDEVIPGPLAKQTNSFVKLKRDEQHKNNQLKSIKVYPNPNNGIFTVHLNSSQYPTQIEIVNTTGNTKYRIKAYSKLTRIELPKLAKGLYFIRTYNQNKQLVEKIIIK